MKNKNIKWVAGTLVSAALTAGITACSDDHFDVNQDVLGQKTLWENIQSREDLSEYADILKGVKYSTTEVKTTPETYADVLCSDQTFTIWAPVNGSFNYEYYKGLLESGKRDSIYKVERELIRNNMSRFSHVLNGQDSVKLSLFNNKAVWLNYSNGTIKQKKITTANIGACNGILHVTEGPVAYQPNMYEYLASSKELDSIRTFIYAFQTTEFNESASTQGPTIDGQITWVDSITYTSNDYTSYYLNAHINREDSNYVMVLPTNEAWKKELSKTSQYYKFKNHYEQDINTQAEDGTLITVKGVSTDFTDAEVDSLNNFLSKDAICMNLAFNANWQYEQIPISSHEDIAKADSIKSTTGLKFKRKGTLKDTDRIGVVEADIPSLFGTNPPVEVSNGHAFIVNDYTFPYGTYAKDQDRLATTIIETVDQCNGSPYTYEYKSTYWKFDDPTRERVDTVCKYQFLRLEPKAATSHPAVFFKLNGILSCKYDIYVVVGYNFNSQLSNKFRAYISYDTADKRVANQTLSNPNKDALDAQGDSIYNTSYFVNRPPYYNEAGERCFTDTICIAKDFEFPIAYYGLTNAYPTIQIKSNFTTRERDYYSRELWINSVILKAKEW